MPANSLPLSPRPTSVSEALEDQPALASLAPSPEEELSPETPAEAGSATVLSPQLDPIAELETRAQCPHPWRQPFRFMGWCLSMLFGIATLIALLSTLAAIPLVNFFVLGYLLEVEGRVARSGKLRDAFPLLGLAPRIGGLVLGIGLCLLPLQILALWAADARLISPGSGADVFLHRLLAVSGGVIGAHILMSLARGGRFTMFLRPIKNLRWTLQQRRTGLISAWNHADSVLHEFLKRLELPRLFVQGFFGFLGAFLWLAPPTLIFAAANKPEGVLVLVTLFGGILLTIALTWVPFLQARFAAERRFSAFWELRAIRELYRQAPLCWSLAVILNFALSLPLYLATVVLPPQDGLRLVAVVFLVSIYPARVIIGWAYAQAAKRTKRTWFSVRLLMGGLLIPTLMFYVFILFFTQFIGASGKFVLFQHHTLLLPVPY